jgi:hypothetical protein
MTPEPDPKLDDLEPQPDLPSNPRAAEGGGFGPSEIPDPMPAALQEHRDQSEQLEAMDGDSPTG